MRYCKPYKISILVGFYCCDTSHDQKQFVEGKAYFSLGEYSIMQLEQELRG